jgi:hypothetical protein
MDKKDLKYSEMSNSELKLKMVSMENEYEVLKKNISNLVSKLYEMDVEYNKIKEIYNKRTRGRIS